MRNISTCCKRAALLLSALQLTLALAGCGEARDDGEQRQIFAMDTVMLLTAYGGNAGAGLDAAESLIDGLNASLDPEREGSEAYALNHAGGGPVAVTEAVRRMLEVSQQVWEKSGGALNPATYPLTKAWGFIGGDYRVPSGGELDTLLEHTAFGTVTISGHTVTLPAGMEMSFGAVAKGYASQSAVEVMRGTGVAAAVISLGGNVQTLGETKPDGLPWTVAVQDPYDTGTYAGLLRVGETAVVTSGGYQRYFERDGVVYHHILDPSTGRPADSGLVSVTVICPDGTTADALSTALFVLGEEKALQYRTEYGGFDLVLITRDNRVVVAGKLDFSEHGDYEYQYIE
jgi:thiamine biosynthesis lipoprotein